ncbi:hypothetical protein [Paenibacillus cymbidii]|uniref:hypothetical protein n=1 Tax=Paenibacillus cymbidii TaxID=1639034 RepID=UPI0010815AD7|nr:hypothetical protein [Paenibacillus cymbidii]
MTTTCHLCASEDDFARASLFLLAHKRDLHPAYTTLEMVTLIYSYATKGRIVSAMDDNRCVVGVSAYYIGTPERDFMDRDVALLDVAIADPAYRGARLFLQGLVYMVQSIIEKEPEVQELRLAALADNDYLCRLYAKFAKPGYEREGSHGKEIVFCVKINTLKGTLNKWAKV